MEQTTSSCERSDWSCILVKSDPRGGDNLLLSGTHWSFGAMPLRPTATKLRTSYEALFRGRIGGGGLEVGG